ncbi:MAG: hypothetical protein WBY44_31275 [Bryobacteraceae bacterium]|jgi:hypothetical protein
MKRLYSLLMLALVCLLAAAPSYAQSHLKVKFSVSFPFIAGTATMPAGTYTITENVSGQALIYPAQGGHGAAILLTRASGFSPANGHATVSFLQRGGRYYLDTVNLLDGGIVGVGKVTR